MFIISVGHKDRDGKETGTEAQEIRHCVSTALSALGPGKLTFDAVQIVQGVKGWSEKWGFEDNTLVICHTDNTAPVEELGRLLAVSQRQDCVAITCVNDDTVFVNALGIVTF
jgi:hypothetical protein